jgi:hypothetical protein
MNTHDGFGDFNSGNSGEQPLWDRLGRSDRGAGPAAEAVPLTEREKARLRFHQWRLKADCEAQVDPSRAS